MINQKKLDLTENDWHNGAHHHVRIAGMRNKPINFYQALYRIATEIDAGTSTKDVLDNIVRSTAETVGVKGCSLMLLTQAEGKLVHIVAYGLSDSYIKKGTVRIDPILDEVLQGNPVFVENAPEDPRIQYKTQAKKEGIVSMLSIPMFLGEEVTGVLRIYTDQTRQFSENDIEFLKLVAGLGAISLRKAREYESQEQYYEQRLQETIDQLYHNQEELEKVEDAKEKLLAFISMVAHDLKAPLAAIQTYFSIMLGGFTGELSEKHKELITKSSVRVEGLLELISDLLDISRIESGQMVQEMEQVSLNEISDTLVEDVGELAAEKNIEFEVDIPDNLHPLHGSPTRLRQLFTNLLSNAVKFTPEGGTVGFSLYENGGMIHGEVKDSGIGIPKEELPRIFEDFYRASNVASISGTGLGLSIVKRIVEAHGGQIRIESPWTEEGTGCRISFTLSVAGI